LKPQELLIWKCVKKAPNKPVARMKMMIIPKRTEMQKRLKKEIILPCIIRVLIKVSPRRGKENSELINN